MTVATASQMFSLAQPREQFLETAQTAKRNTQVILLLTAAVLAIHQETEETGPYH